jgi:hypothetical protein
VLRSRTSVSLYLACSTKDCNDPYLATRAAKPTMHDDKPDLEFKSSQPGSPDLKPRHSDSLQELERPTSNIPALRYDDTIHLDLPSGNSSTMDLNPERTTADRGMEMTTFRRLSAVASVERDRFRRGSAAGSVEGRDRFRRASVLGRTETRIGEAGEGELSSGVRVDGDTVVAGDGDHVERGTIDGGFGWVIVACQYLPLFFDSTTTLTHGPPLRASRFRSTPKGTFTIAFHFLGFIFSWGVIQAALVDQELESTRLLSVIGGLATFWNAAGCFPVGFLLCFEMITGSMADER